MFPWPLTLKIEIGLTINYIISELYPQLKLKTKPEVRTDFPFMMVKYEGALNSLQFSLNIENLT